VAVDERPQPHAPGTCCQRCQRAPSFKTGTGRIAQDRKEMIEVPCRVEAQLVNQLPDLTKVLPCGVLLRCLNSESDRFAHYCLRDYHQPEYAQRVTLVGVILMSTCCPISIVRYLGYFSRKRLIALDCSSAVARPGSMSSALPAINTYLKSLHSSE